MKSIEGFCDEALYEVLNLLSVEVIVGVGRFAEKKAATVISKYHLKDIQVVFISHPSPRNPASNKDWLLTTKQTFMELDLLKYFSV